MLRICPRDSANALSSAPRMDELKNFVAWLENAPVAMALMELKSVSTFLALKLVRSVKKVRAACCMAGSLGASLSARA